MIFLIYSWKKTDLIYLDHNDKRHPIPRITPEICERTSAKIKHFKII